MMRAMRLYGVRNLSHKKVDNAPTPTNKFCVNCKYVIHDSNPFYTYNGTNKLFSKCWLFSKINHAMKHTYLVSGDLHPRQIEYYSCYEARKYDTMCGEKGKYFNEKNKK